MRLNKKKTGLILIVLIAFFGLSLFVYAVPVIVDVDTGQPDDVNLEDLHPSDHITRYSAFGHSFTTLTTRYKITSARFYLAKDNNPTGNATAVLYAHSGVYGTSSVPTGGALATSEPFDVSTLGDPGQFWETFTFNSSQQYIMDPDTYYVIVLQGPTSGQIDHVDHLIVGYDNTPDHDGNRVGFLNGNWIAENDDLAFYVYGESYNTTITSATITNMDDTDNLYAMRTGYNFTVELDDDGGATEIREVHLQGKQESTVRFEVRATDLDTTPTVWTLQTGSTIIDLNTTACSWTESGDTGTAVFNILFEWDYPQEEDIELEVYVEDEDGGSTGFSVMQSNYTDIITRLVTYNFGANVSSTPIETPIELSGYVRYATTTTGNLASSLYPPDGQFTSVQIQNDQEEIVGTDVSIASGYFNDVFNASSIPRTTMYYAYLDLLADYVDGLAPDSDVVYVTTIPAFYLSQLIDQAFSTFGILDYIVNATAYGTALGSYFIDSITNIMTLITQQFLLVLGVFDFFIDWYTRMVSLVISIGNAVTGLLDGTGDITTGLGNVWDWISFGDWIDVVPVFFFIWWVDSITVRGERQGEITVFFGDLSTIFNVTSWLLSMFSLVINTVTDLAFRLLGVIT